MEMKVEFEIELPSTEKEILLAEIWAKLLNVDIKKIGRQTSFFELGGDSISAIQLVVGCRQRDLVLKTVDVFNNPTLSALSEKLSQFQTVMEQHYQIP